MNKALLSLLSICSLLSLSLKTAPLTVWRAGNDREVMVYVAPQQEDEIQEMLGEIKQLQGYKIIVDGVKPESLAPYIGTGMAVSFWDSLPVEYLDVRAAEQVSLLIYGIGSSNAMDYLMGSIELAPMYQQVWGLSESKATQLAARYQKLFAPARQQCQQLLAKLSDASKKPSDREIDAVEVYLKRFHACFLDHLFVNFNVSRKALVAEHVALMREIEKYTDVKELQDVYQQWLLEFKMKALWLQDAAADEPLSSYARRVDLLSDEEKKNLELIKKEAAHMIEDYINLVLLGQLASPLIAIRAMHIVENNKNVALIIADSAVYTELVELLIQRGYAE